MHPILIAGYMLNLLLINGIWGWIALIAAVAASGGIYYFISNGKGPKFKHVGQLVAFAAIYLLGSIAIFQAPWGNIMVSAGVLIMEIFVFAIFAVMRR